jgi:hypothetical protein
MSVFVAILAISAPAVLNLALLMRLRDHRIDISPGQSFSEGSSPFGWINVLRTGNYSSAGQRLLVWYRIGLALQIVGFLVAGSLISLR